MINVAIFICAYLLFGMITIALLFRICAKIRNVNLRLLAKSSCIALLFTPTLSVPATIPIPALVQLLGGAIALQPALVLAGLMPIIVAIFVIFLMMKATGVLRPRRRE